MIFITFNIGYSPVVHKVRPTGHIRPATGSHVACNRRKANVENREGLLLSTTNIHNDIQEFVAVV